jgi:hypothetical protein
MELGDVTILTDEELRSYALAGWTRSIFAMVSPRSATNYLRARRSGFKQTKKAGSDLQQGGVLIVKPDGEIAYRFQSRSTGDHPPAKDVVAALVTAIT